MKARIELDRSNDKLWQAMRRCRLHLPSHELRAAGFHDLLESLRWLRSYLSARAAIDWHKTPGTRRAIWHA
ncbi:MAG TPA: hypothetical protein VGF45_09910, partial [Polyangia bacterium]